MTTEWRVAPVPALDAARLRAALKRRNISLTVFSAVSGVGIAAIGDFLNGRRRPYRVTLLALAAGLDRLGIPLAEATAPREAATA